MHAASATYLPFARVVGPVRNDITAARTHAFPAPYPRAAAGLPTLTDKGYVGAGIGIHVPFKGANLAPEQPRPEPAHHRATRPRRTRHALLKSTFKALRRITLCPRRIGHIVAAALVILTMHRGRW